MTYLPQIVRFTFFVNDLRKLCNLIDERLILLAIRRLKTDGILALFFLEQQFN